MLFLFIKKTTFLISSSTSCPSFSFNFFHTFFETKKNCLLESSKKTSLAERYKNYPQKKPRSSLSSQKILSLFFLIFQTVPSVFALFCKKTFLSESKFGDFLEVQNFLLVVVILYVA